MSRWCEFECLRLAYNVEYARCRRFSSALSWATAIFAILTATMAVWQDLGGGELASKGTVVLGLFTGAAGILKQTFKWDEKANAHRETLAKVRDGMTSIGLWIERLAEGHMEDDAFLERMGSAFNTIMSNSEFQSLDSWEAAASDSAKRKDLDGIPFRPVAAVAAAPEPVSEAPAEGVVRMVRGR